MGSSIKALINFPSVSLTASVTRSADTLAYAIGDVIGNASDDGHYDFSKDGTGIVSSRLMTGSLNVVRVISSANQATLPDLELWLFSTDIADIADNSAFAPTDEEMLTLIGVVDLPVDSWRVGNSASGAAGNSVCEISDIDIPFRLNDNKNIYGQLVVRDSYTPVSGEVFTTQLFITQDS